MEEEEVLVNICFTLVFLNQGGKKEGNSLIEYFKTIFLIFFFNFKTQL